MNSAELKRKDRARKRELGFVLKQIWVKPEQWESIKKHIDKSNKKVGKNERITEKQNPSTLTNR